MAYVESRLMGRPHRVAERLKNIKSLPQIQPTRDDYGPDTTSSIASTSKESHVATVTAPDLTTLPDDVLDTLRIELGKDLGNVGRLSVREMKELFQERFYSEVVYGGIMSGPSENLPYNSLAAFSPAYKITNVIDVDVERTQDRAYIRIVLTPHSTIYTSRPVPTMESVQYVREWSFPENWVESVDGVGNMYLPPPVKNGMVPVRWFQYLVTHNGTRLVSPELANAHLLYDRRPILGEGDLVRLNDKGKDTYEQNRGNKRISPDSVMKIKEDIGFENGKRMWEVVDADNSNLSDIYFEDCLTKIDN